MTAELTKCERTYRTLRERILQGTYAPGKRLVVATLGAELGVSSIPVREALRRLEAEGWVTYRANAGAEVRPVDVSEWLACMDALALLEAHATALAAAHLDPDELVRAAAANEEIRAALERHDALAASDANRRFHQILCAPCPSAYLSRLVDETNERLDAMRRTVLVFVPLRAWAATKEHEQLLALIRRGAEADEIETAARAHKQRTIDAYLVQEGSTAGDPLTPPRAPRRGRAPAALRTPVHG